MIDIDGLYDILDITLKAIRRGARDSEYAEVTLTQVVLVSHEGKVATPVYAFIADEDSSRKSFVYSRYDLNKDGEVDAVDLGIALLAMGRTADDADWDTFPVSWDALGRPITPAVIDVNGDKTINMLDILDIMRNYTDW